MSSTSQSSSAAKSQQQSQLLSIAAEVRLTIWSFAIASNERLILDPENVILPHPLSKGDYGPSFAVLLTSKQTHREVLPLLYSWNTVAVVDPYSGFDLFDRIPQTALAHIKRIELCLQFSLEDAAVIWDRLVNDLTSLNAIRLLFYQTPQWLRDAASIANYCWTEGNVTLKLELFESDCEDISNLVITSDRIEDELDEANDRENLFNLCIPSEVKTITIAASVGPEAASAFENFNGGFCDWFFLKDRGKSSRSCQCFVWYGEESDAKQEWLERELQVAQTRHQGEGSS